MKKRLIQLSDENLEVLEKALSLAADDLLKTDTNWQTMNMILSSRNLLDQILDLRTYIHGIVENKTTLCALCGLITPTKAIDEESGVCFNCLR